MNRIARLCSLLVLVSASVAWADGVRTAVSAIVTLDQNRPETTVILRYNEAVGVFLPADPMFIKGVEFELRLPAAARGSESSILWSIYSSVSPAPSIDEVEYRAEPVASQPLPSRVSIILKAPIVERSDLRSDSFATVVPAVLSPARFPLMFKLSPIGKGYAPNVERAEFKLTVRPIIGDEGGIRISAVYPEGGEKSPLSVYLDDRRIDDPSGVIVARKGLRLLRVSATGYREEVLSLDVSAGRISPVTVSLVPDVPRVSFQAPAGSVIVLDGQLVGADQLAGMAVEVGEHVVVCRIGDYAMTRKFMAVRGKVYRVVLSVDLEISSTP